MGLTINILILLDLIFYVVSDRVILLNTTRDGWKDWRKNTEKYQGWRIQNLPPNGDEVYGVCDVNQRSSNSWLRSPFIPRQKGIILHVKLSFTMRECKNYADSRQLVNCEEVFHLLKYESDFDNRDIQYEEKYFAHVETISSNLKWEDKDRTENILNVHESTISVRRSGVIIAFKNTGSCVMIKEVVIFYTSCPGIVNNFVSFPQAATGSGEFARNIEGRCVDGAVKVAPAEQLLNFCQPNGKWRREMFAWTCECSPGHEGNGNKTNCLRCAVNYHKSSVGHSLCSACPVNTHSPHGSAHCYCNSGFYEIPASDASMMCQKPPPKPRNLQVDASDLARIVLSWDPLESENSGVNDSNNGLKYSIVCVNCPNTLVVFPSANTTGNKVVIHGALPSREYNFKVTSENVVTPFVTNVFDMNQCTSKISVITSPLENIEKVIIDKVELVDKSIFLRWIRPKTSHDKVEYECVLYGYKDRLTAADSKNPDLSLYFYTGNTQYFYSRSNSDILFYTAKVRWRNSRGWGQFSQTKSIEVEKGREQKNNDITFTDEPIRSSNQSTQSNIDESGQHVKKEVILVLLILLAVVVIIVIFLVICCVRRQLLFSAYRMKIKKHKYESSNQTQMIYSSAYSLPIQSYAKYHDPSTYEDISIALQDFTKEIDPQSISADSLIGEGQFADVFCGTIKTHREAEIVVAIKVLKASATVKEKNNFLIEASTMGQFQHENIIRLQGVVSLSEPYTIVTEYMVNGSLLEFLPMNKDSITTLQQVKMLSNVCAGMKYLSLIGFIHRDLAARNILLDLDYTCKIADFGLSRELTCDDSEKIYQNKNDTKIPIKWTSPEAILYQRFSHAGDVWSFGVLAWEIFSMGDRPYWQWTNQEVIDNIQSGYRLPPPVNCPTVIHNVMLHCWHCKPGHRPTFNQLYFELDEIMTRLFSESQVSDFNGRREYKIGEKAHLLRHYQHMPQSDDSPDIMVPQPPPRNVAFESRTGKKGSIPDTTGSSLPLTRQSSCCSTNPSGCDFRMKEPIMTMSKVNPSVVPLQCHYPSNVFYQPCVLQPAHEYRSYGTDLILSNLPDIPPHKVSSSPAKTTTMSVDDFLVSINIPQYISLFRQAGLYTTSQIQPLRYDHFRSLGISSKYDINDIIRALTPPIYC